ncbi:MAG: TAXI family TRAP transporter solute-binding subunit [Alphaproteobacteria bacterium]|nr:TAXI family TRAP transporter solute-binding subunit [Alphaproteobacteria bacterium]
MLKRIQFSSAALALALGAALPAAAADNYRFMTGPQGGVWVPLGGAIKNVFEKSIPGVAVQVLPGAGIANVRGIDEDKAEIGFGNSISTVDGVNGDPPFPRKAANVCNLGSLYPQYFQVVALADAKINSIKDLKGKSIAIQPRGNTAELATKQILEVHGLKYEDMKVNFMSYTDAVSLLKDGHAQVFTAGTTIPSSAVMDLAAARDIKLIDLSDSVEGMRKINKGYAAVTLPANTYAKQDKPVTKIGYAAHLMVSCKLKEDHVYQMTKLIAANMKDFSVMNKPMESVTPKMMADDIGVPFHPGARKFYREVGAMM